ncbi:2-nitropropane dioxygenase [Coprinopsis cinerea AmutBmut pab1-1]|nr:2-nitropropane dioxygenase [Coprinopsis cinerea AmutBmut pab1-1]
MLAFIFPSAIATRPLFTFPSLTLRVPTTQGRHTYTTSKTRLSAQPRTFSTSRPTRMSLVTPVTELLGIRVPVVQGGMQWVGVPKLVAAVSEAGGLGVLTALTQPSPEALRVAIRETKKLTSKPFGVNITLLPSITPPDYPGYARAAVEEGVRIFETAGNNPGPLIKYFKENNCIVIHKCTAIRHAKSAERHGVDILSIDGFECAGHPGEDDIGGLVLLARAARELKVPFLASGGIADARGFAAALTLGAAGVNLGTRFMCTVESPIHQNIKEKIVASTERDTVHIFRTLHNTARVFKNKISMEVVKIEKQGNAKFEDIKDLVSGERGRKVYELGDPDYGIWTAGIVMGLIDDIPTCKDLVERLERETVEILQSTAKLAGLEVRQKAKL